MYTHQRRLAAASGNDHLTVKGMYHKLFPINYITKIDSMFKKAELKLDKPLLKKHLILLWEICAELQADLPDTFKGKPFSDKTGVPNGEEIKSLIKILKDRKDPSKNIKTYISQANRHMEFWEKFSQDYAKALYEIKRQKTEGADALRKASSVSDRALKVAQRFLSSN